MRQIRIALADVTDELLDILGQGLADQPDLALVAVASGEVEMLLQAAQMDVVVVGMQGRELPPVAERLLDEYPRLGVVGVDLEAECGVVYRLRPNLQPIADLSPQAIATAIRSAAENTTA